MGKQIHLMANLLKIGILPAEHGSCVGSDVAVESLLIIFKHSPESIVVRAPLK
jgi:hypothetical protein